MGHYPDILQKVFTQAHRQTETNKNRAHLLNAKLFHHVFSSLLGTSLALLRIADYQSH